MTAFYLEFYGICFALMLAFVVGVKCGRGWYRVPKPERDPKAEAFVARLRASVRQPAERRAA